MEWNQKIKREFCHFRLELFKLHTLLDNGNELKTNKLFISKAAKKGAEDEQEGGVKSWKIWWKMEANEEGKI